VNVNNNTNTKDHFKIVVKFPPTEDFHHVEINMLFYSNAQAVKTKNAIGITRFGDPVL
jgi:hypothetical protein